MPSEPHEKLPESRRRRGICVAASGADKMDALSANTGIGGLASFVHKRAALVRRGILSQKSMHKPIASIPMSNMALELSRRVAAANTRIGAKRIHLVRTRGGNRKFRALRLDSGNFSWGSEGIAKKVRVIAVASTRSNNELVRTNTSPGRRRSG